MTILNQQAVNDIVALVMDKFIEDNGKSGILMSDEELEEAMLVLLRLTADDATPSIPMNTMINAANAWSAKKLD